MNKKHAVIAGAVLFVTACSHRDLAGNKLSPQAEAALSTCNAWLSSKMRGTLGGIDASEAVFVQNGPDQLDIAWRAQTKAGQGAVVCSTNATGTYVRGANIDGIQVTP